MQKTHPEPSYVPIVEMKYIIVLRKDWTEEEINKLNHEYKNVAKWIYGD